MPGAPCSRATSRSSAPVTTRSTETIVLLDRMKELGFRQATRSGLSFAASDLRAPDNKEGVLRDKDKEVAVVRKNFDNGIITEVERYNRVIDLWIEARDQISKKMMTDLANDRRKDQVNRSPKCADTIRPRSVLPSAARPVRRACPALSPLSESVL